MPTHYLSSDGKLGASEGCSDDCCLGTQNKRDKERDAAETRAPHLYGSRCQRLSIDVNAKASGWCVESLGNPYIRAHRGGSEGHLFDAPIEHSPLESVNILGLSTLAKLGLHLDSTGFKFNEGVLWF